MRPDHTGSYVRATPQPKRRVVIGAIAGIAVQALRGVPLIGLS